jgi:hypothetical protein
MKCPKCNSQKTRKKGYYENKFKVKIQIIYCNECEKHYNLSKKVKRNIKTDFEKIILKLRKENKTYEKIKKEIKKKHYYNISTNKIVKCINKNDLIKDIIKDLSEEEKGILQILSKSKIKDLSDKARVLLLFQRYNKEIIINKYKFKKSLINNTINDFQNKRLKIFKNDKIKNLGSKNNFLGYIYYYNSDKNIYNDNKLIPEDSKKLFIIIKSNYNSLYGISFIKNNKIKNPIIVIFKNKEKIWANFHINKTKYSISNSKYNITLENKEQQEEILSKVEMFHKKSRQNLFIVF